MKTYTLYIVFLCATASAFAQTDSSVIITQKGNDVLFKASLPQLTQIPGAPRPFYSYLWDFGDGHFSTEENPTHLYTKEGNYVAVLHTVNNYDDGKKPGRNSKKVVVPKVNKSYLANASPSEKNFFKANGFFELKYNCMAKPGDTMVLIAGWKNNVVANGKVYLFINEKQFDQNSFDTAGFRLYNDAVILNNKNKIASIRSFDQLTLTSSGSPASHFKEEKKFSAAESKAFVMNTLQKYNNVYAVEIKQASENAQFMFTSLYVTPGMIKDTNATILITGLFVPDTGGVYMHQLNIPIVTSHDPNKMNLKQGRLNYRTLKKSKSLTYKIRFQNDGEGPARKIKLAITLPSAMDPQTINIKDMSPYCLPCDSVPSKTGCWELIAKQDSVAFVFNGIYLPGTNQAGITDKDSTKGFVEFEVKTKKKLENLPFTGRTAIYFDKNDPVITNFATGKFKRAISPIVIAGYEIGMGANGLNNTANIGVGIARLAPYKPYFQVELLAKYDRTNSVIQTFQTQGSIAIDSKFYDYRSYRVQNKRNLLRVGLVPLHFRYNLNNFLSVGVGVRVDADLVGSVKIVHTYLLNNFNEKPNFPYSLEKRNAIKTISNTQVLPFVDVQVGKVRLGPQIGTRFYYGLTNNSYIYFYTSWRL